MPIATDITGYGRKMGRDAGLDDEGRALSVIKLQGERMPEGTITFRTINPSNTESAGGIGDVGDYAPTSARSGFFGDGATGNPRNKGN